MAVLGTVLTVASTIMGAIGQIQQAQTQKAYASYQGQLAERQAEYMKQQAKQEEAASQRAYENEMRRGILVQSRLGAIAAASGAGAMDPGIIDLKTDIDTESEFRAMTALFEGKQRASDLEYNAALTQAGGQAQAAAGKALGRLGYIKAAGTLLEGGASLYEKYRPKTKPSSSVDMTGWNQDWNYGYG